MQFKSSLILALVASSFIVPVAFAEDSSSTSASTTAVIDFKGRPPFARHRATTETASLARFEETQVTSSVKFRGRPPFSRHTAPSATVHFARFEETADSVAPRRVGPPGKMTSRRH